MNENWLWRSWHCSMEAKKGHSCNFFCLNAIIIMSKLFLDLQWNCEKINPLSWEKEKKGGFIHGGNVNLVHLVVGLSAGLHRNYWMDFLETCMDSSHNYLLISRKQMLFPCNKLACYLKTIAVCFLEIMRWMNPLSWENKHCNVEMTKKFACDLGIVRK